jgi:hypothetical protein
MTQHPHQWLLTNRSCSGVAILLRFNHLNLQQPSHPLWGTFRTDATHLTLRCRRHHHTNILPLLPQKGMWLSPDMRLGFSLK